MTNSEVTNADLYQALGGIRESIGGLKASVDLSLKGLENHSGRISALEKGAASQKGAAKVWTLVGSGIGAAVGGAAAIFAAWLGHKP